MEKLKVLNLYAGIGGNRKLWEGVEVTAVEYNEEIAAIYQEYFPDDTMIVGDAHEYLLKHYKEFDFIWSSRPCQTHSRPRFWASKGGRYPVLYPDMTLYQEIIFLKNFFTGKWVVENVIPYYNPLIKPDTEIDRHLFWANFVIPPISIKRKFDQTWAITSNSNIYGFEIKERKMKHRKDQILRNLVNPEIGLYILEQARGIIRSNNTSQAELFN
jgi:DNA (cytosine-5)-methyltransferase 1